VQEERCDGATLLIIYIFDVVAAFSLALQASCGLLAARGSPINTWALRSIEMCELTRNGFQFSDKNRHQAAAPHVGRGAATLARATLTRVARA